MSRDLTAALWPAARLGEALHSLATHSRLLTKAAQLTDPRGNRLSAPLDVFSEVAWTGYANATIAGQVAPVLRDLLSQRSLLD